MTRLPPEPWQLHGTPHSFAIFMACWVLFGLGTSIFYAKASYETKKSLHPFIMIGTGVVFLSFAEWITRGNIPWFFAVAVVVVMYFNIRMTQFCPRCNATIRPRGFSRPKFCPRCGAELPVD